MNNGKNKPKALPTGDNHLRESLKFVSAWLDPELQRRLTESAKLARRSRSSQLAFIIEEKFGRG